MPQSQFYDVIVVGSGIGGICAAVTSARTGAETLLLEKMAEIGGTGVHSPVALVCSFADRSGRYVIDGLHREFFPYCYQGDPFAMYTYNEQDLLRRYRDAVAGEPLLTCATSATVESVNVVNSRVESLKVDGLSPRRIAASVYVDSTAEGHLCHMTGAQTMLGNAQGNLQPATLTFKVSGIDFQKFACDLPSGHITNWHEYATVRQELNHHYQQLSITNGTSNPREDVLLFPYPDEPDSVLFNQTRIVGVKPWDAQSVAAGMTEGRKQIDEFFNAIRRHPAFAHARIAFISSKLGVREGRRVVGDYILTRDDCLGEARFDDMVGCGAYAIDIHPTDGKGKTELIPIPGSGYYHIPARCLRAKGFDNLLMGSRCISGDHEAHGSYRVMTSISAIGMAAGVIAALTSVEKLKNIRHLDIRHVQYQLREQGQFVEIHRAR